MSDTLTLDPGRIFKDPLRHGKYCWAYPLPEYEAVASSAERPFGSTLQLFENSTPLHGHAIATLINGVGKGLYLHRGPLLYFTTTDDSDPRRNGREYRFFFDDAQEQWGNRTIQSIPPEFQERFNTLSQVAYVSGRPLRPETKILDYGCGDGRFVLAMRDAGLQAYGFDIHDRVATRHAEDKQHFLFFAGANTDQSLYEFDADSFSIPIEDGFFDASCSFSVFEHVQNIIPVFAELSRVLGQGGISVNMMPRMLQLYEPHIYTPLGTMIGSYWYLYLAALLGIRNEYQHDMPPAKVAQANAEYFKKGIQYLSKKTLEREAKTFFPQADVIDHFKAAFWDHPPRWAYDFAHKLPHLFSPRLWAGSTPLYALRLMK